MKSFRIHPFALVVSVALSLWGCDRGRPAETTTDPVTGVGSTTSDIDSTLDQNLTPTSVVAEAFAQRTSDLQVMVRGKVVKFLPDDLEGDKHQKLIVELDNRQTLLVAHNIDLAGRLPASALDRLVYVFGEYEWNDQGGVVHWTHKDPDRTHVDGWIQWQGVRYQ